MRMIEDLPNHILARGTVEIRGELYGKDLIPARSQRLAAGHLRKKVNLHLDKELSFLQIKKRLNIGHKK